ncbi:MAG: hypothetical protein U1E65_15280 [Myxococcota bacterium]
MSEEKKKSRAAGREESQFLRGEIGVDGQSVEEELSEEEIDRAKAVEELARGRTYLGREFLTWLLWRTNAAGTLITVDDEPITGLFVQRITLRGLAGDATELVARGASSPYSKIVRDAIRSGLLVHVGRIRLSHADKIYEVTLDAEHLRLRSAQIPKVLSEEEDDKIAERMFLAEKLGEIVDSCFRAFLEVRSSKRWRKDVVPSLIEWLES